MMSNEMKWNEWTTEEYTHCWELKHRDPFVQPLHRRTFPIGGIVRQYNTGQFDKIKMQCKSLITFGEISLTNVIISVCM